MGAWACSSGALVAGKVGFVLVGWVGFGVFHFEEPAVVAVHVFGSAVM
jgi:hypothetical protein